MPGNDLLKRPLIPFFLYFHLWGGSLPAAGAADPRGYHRTEVYYALGNCYLLQEQFEPAAAYGHAVARDPGHTYAWLILTKANYYMKAYAEAGRCFAGELWPYMGWGMQVVWDDPAITTVMATWFYYVCLLHLHLTGSWSIRSRTIYAASGFSGFRFELPAGVGTLSMAVLAPILRILWRKAISIHLTVLLCLLLILDLAWGYLCLKDRGLLFAPLNDIGLGVWINTYGRLNLFHTAWFFILLGLLSILCLNTFVCTTDRVIGLLGLRAKPIALQAGAPPDALRPDPDRLSGRLPVRPGTGYAHPGARSVHDAAGHGQPELFTPLLQHWGLDRRKMKTIVCKSYMTLMMLALTAFSAWTADAEEPKEKQTVVDLVVTATRSEEKIEEIPTKIEVINREGIELTVGDTITEQLKKNTSIGVIEYPGALAGIGIRGFRPEFSGITKHSLTLKNGRPAGTTNLATVLTDNIERIEVLKGPASSLYGGEAMGGVVNIITKKHTDELTGKAEAGFGSYETNFQKVSLGGGLGSRFDFDIYGRRYDQQDNITMGSGEKRANTSYETQNGGLRLGADLGETWRIDVSGDIYQGRDIETPGDIAYGDARPQNKDIDNYGMDFTIGGYLGMNNRLSLTGYYTGEESEYYNRYSGSTIVPPYRSYDSETSWLGFQLKDEIAWSAHRFLLGVDCQKIDKESRSYNTNGYRKAPFTPDESRENWAGYLETIWKFMDERLTATAGGRYDTFDVETVETPYKSDFTPNSESFSTFSPRAGLNYLFNMGARLHTTVGQGFVPPSAFELAGYSETEVQGETMITEGNSNLDPETSLTYDVGLGFDRPVWGLILDVTYFHTDVEDKIVSMQTGNYKTYENGLGAEIEGLETMILFDIGALLGWDRSLSLFANSTHIFKAEEEQSDGTMKDIHNVAEYTVNYGVQYKGGLFDGKVHVRNQGKMKDTDWVTAGYPEIEYLSFMVVDLALGVTLLDHHRLLFKVDNIFDEDYYEKKGYPKPGRAFYGSYSFEF